MLVGFMQKSNKDINLNPCIHNLFVMFASCFPAKNTETKGKQSDANSSKIQQINENLTDNWSRLNKYVESLSHSKKQQIKTT
jgi:hypothetical protein